MDSEIEGYEIKTKKNNQNKQNSNTKINKILYLQIINLLLFFMILFHEIKNIFLNKQNIQKIEEKQKNTRSTTSEKIKYLKLLTNNNEEEYKGIQECLLSDPEEKFCIYHLILPKDVIGKKRILLGEKYDGCYVLLDDFKKIKYAYSFGINNNIQFDKALADKGIDVYMYDHTINSLPYENPKFHWKKIGLCGMKSQNQNMKNFEELIAENGHNKEKNMILKMDIEQWEFESLIDLKEKTLNQFKYIAIEYHFKDENKFKNNNVYYNVLKKNFKSSPSFLY